MSYDQRGPLDRLHATTFDEAGQCTLQQYGMQAGDQEYLWAAEADRPTCGDLLAVRAPSPTLPRRAPHVGAGHLGSDRTVFEDKHVVGQAPLTASELHAAVKAMLIGDTVRWIGYPAEAEELKMATARRKRCVELAMASVQKPPGRLHNFTNPQVYSHSRVSSSSVRASTLHAVVHRGMVTWGKVWEAEQVTTASSLDSIDEADAVDEEVPPTPEHQAILRGLRALPHDPLPVLGVQAIRSAARSVQGRTGLGSDRGSPRLWAHASPSAVAALRLRATCYTCASSGRCGLPRLCTPWSF